MDLDFSLEEKRKTCCTFVRKEDEELSEDGESQSSNAHTGIQIQWQESDGDKAGV